MIWQLVVWSGWKSETILPAPATVFKTLYDEFGTLTEAAWRTLQRAFVGFRISILLGTAIGAAVARIPVLRAVVGSLITGLQTMPSMRGSAAIVLFQLSEGAILFVVVIGATPSIARAPRGLRHDPADHAAHRAGPRRAGHRHPASHHPPRLAAVVRRRPEAGGRSRGGASSPVSCSCSSPAFSLGQQLSFSQEFARYDFMYATMIVILVIGVVIDSLFFATAERTIRKRYGFVDEAAAG